MFFQPSEPAATPTPQRRKTDNRPDLVKMAKVECYWRSLIGSAQVPSRNDVDPTAVSDALSDSMVLERVGPGIARIRLAGQRINSLLDMDMRGMPLSVLVTPSCREELATRIEAAFDGPALVEIPLTLNRGWRKDIEARVLVLPLRDAQERVTRALAVLTTRQPMPAGNTARFAIATEELGRCTFMPQPAKRTKTIPLSGVERRVPQAQPDTDVKQRFSVTRDMRPERVVSTPLSVVEGDVDTPRESRIENERTPAPAEQAERGSHLRLVFSR